MGKTAHQRRIHPDLVQHHADVFNLLFRRNQPMDHRGLTDDVDDAHSRIERRIRILKDHLHLELCTPRRGRARCPKRLAAPPALTLRRLQQADSEPSERRLAASRFANEPHDFTFTDAKIDIVDGVHDFLGRFGAKHVADLRRDVERFDEALRDAVQLQQRRGASGGDRWRNG